MKPVELLKSIRAQQGLSGEALLRAFKAQPTIWPIRLPPGFDDSDDIHPLLLSLTDEERSELGLEVPVSPAQPPIIQIPHRDPTYQVSVQAILCANDDGSGGAADRNAVDANYVKELLDILSQIYHDAGVHFVYDPATDFERVNSSLLNLDFTVPPGLEHNFDRPETQSPFDGFNSREGGQSNWRWCRKCQGLFFAGNSRGICPEGGEHDPSGSGDYSLIKDRPAGGQSNWRWCRKCQGLFFAGNSRGVCPEGGEHDPSGSGDYCVLPTMPSIGQGDWRWCRKCQGLFFAGNNHGACPAEGQHDPEGSWDYDLMSQEENLAIAHLEERQRIAIKHRGKMVLFFCDGNQLTYDRNQKKWTTSWRGFSFSAYDLEFVAMGTGKSGDVKSHAYLLGHESGHYFHLAHTHRWEVKLTDEEKKSLLDNWDNWDKRSEAERDVIEAEIRRILIERAATMIRDYVSSGHSRADGADVFDGDKPSNSPPNSEWHLVDDTPPDPSWELLDWANGWRTGGLWGCGPVDSVSIPAFPDHPPYMLKPDRGNALSYFKGCTNFVMHFSPQQIVGIRESMEKKNRQHLIPHLTRDELPHRR